MPAPYRRWRWANATMRSRRLGSGSGRGTYRSAAATPGRRLAPVRSSGTSPRWSLERRPDGTFQRAYMGAWNTITVASAADLLMRWWSQLRQCQHESCRAWFLPTHGRQRYHTARCSAEARYQRFKPKRNYKNEYARRYDTTRTPARRGPARKGKYRNESAESCVHWDRSYLAVGSLARNSSNQFSTTCSCGDCWSAKRFAASTQTIRPSGRMS